MAWKKILKKDTANWNEKLKATNAAFYQYPYYVSGEYDAALSKGVFIEYIQMEKTVAYAAIIEIGFAPFKVGVIDSGPVVLDDNIELPKIINDLKKFAEHSNYMHLQVRPAFGSLIHATLKNDACFEPKIYFPFHQKVEFDSNIYNKPEPQLLAGFKMQCRRKIVLAGRLAYKFFKAEDEKTLADIRTLFAEVKDTKGYTYLPFKIYESIYRKGKKHNLCDFYAVYLDDKLVNVALIMKDAQSFYHYTSALTVHGYKPSESPPAKLHFFVMQDCFYNEHKEHYDISFGGSDNLIRFKELFNPVEIERPPYYTFIIKKKLLNFTTKFFANNATIIRKSLKKVNTLFTKKTYSILLSTICIMINF